METVHEKNLYSQVLQQSRFCLVLDGHYPWTIRFLDVLQHGCVPVILSESWHPPLHRLLAWTGPKVSHFPTVVVHPRWMHKLDRILGQIKFNHWVEMQALTMTLARTWTCEEDLGPPIVAMLESPSEDAMSRTTVEEMFSRHELKVVWANEDHGWNDFQHATVLVTVKRRVDDALLATLPRLRLVAVAFTGYDHVDLEACKKRNVAVANVPGYSTDGAAELCFGLIFSLLRHIPMAHQHVRSGKWNWPPGNELCGRRFGSASASRARIGLRVAEISKAFRVSKIIGYDPVKNDKFLALGGEYVESLATVFLHAVARR
eukprot:g23955.t1